MGRGAGHPTPPPLEPIVPNSGNRLKTTPFAHPAPDRLSSSVLCPLLVGTLMFPQRVPSEGGVAWGPSPSRRRYRPQSTMTPPTSCPPSERPHCYACSLILPYWKRRQDLPRLPIHYSCMPCSQTPEVPPTPAHHRGRRWCLRAHSNSRPPHKIPFSGAQSLQPCGLRPTTSLSTLNV